MNELRVKQYLPNKQGDRGPLRMIWDQDNNRVAECVPAELAPVFASAPDLLEALKGLLTETLDAFGVLDQFASDDDRLTDQPAIVRAKEVILKAETDNAVPDLGSPDPFSTEYEGH